MHGPYEETLGGVLIFNIFKWLTRWKGGHTHTLMHAHTHARTHSRTHTHTHTHTDTHTQTHTHRHTHTQTHTHTHTDFYDYAADLLFGIFVERFCKFGDVPRSLSPRPERHEAHHSRKSKQEVSFVRNHLHCRGIDLNMAGYAVRLYVVTWEGRKEGNVLFNDALNTFYLRLYGVRRMVKEERKCFI